VSSTAESTVGITLDCWDIEDMVEPEHCQLYCLGTPATVRKS
jgi:hypothetical protein